MSISPQSEETQDSEPMYETIESLADLLLPDVIPFNEVRQHLKGYDKKKAIHQIVERAREEPAITRLRLWIVYGKLDELLNNGGL